MIIYHDSNIVVKEPKVIKSKYSKDFRAGFYCTTNYDQAKRWAKRNNDNCIVNYYEWTKDPSLLQLKFNNVNDEWLDFIAGNIPRSVFFEYAKFKHPTNQINFANAKSLKCIKFLKAEKVNDKGVIDEGKRKR